MADTNDLLQQIRTIVREENEPLKQDIAILKDGQAHNTTMLDAVLAGQQELQKTAAREATVLSIANKLTKRVNEHEERIAKLEKEVGIPHPHKP